MPGMYGVFRGITIDSRSARAGRIFAASGFNQPHRMGVRSCVFYVRMAT